MINQPQEVLKVQSAPFWLTPGLQPMARGQPFQKKKKGRCLTGKEISRTQAIKNYFLLRLGVNFENVWIPKMQNSN